MGFLDIIARKQADDRAARQHPNVTMGHATGQGAPPIPRPPANGMTIVAPPTPDNPVGVTQVVPPGMAEAPSMPMGRPSVAVIDTGIRQPSVLRSTQDPGFWDRLIAGRQAGYLANRR